DNMKTAVETVFIGKDRQYNRRFLRMCGHYLIEPTACTPAAGWEKGQVENQVGVVRERFFTPRLRVASYEELNAWLLDRCVAYAKAHKHPELANRTVWRGLVPARLPLIVSRRTSAQDGSGHRGCMFRGETRWRQWGFRRTTCPMRSTARSCAAPSSRRLSVR